MPIAYEVSENGSLVLVRTTGKVGLNDLKVLPGEIVGDRRIEPCFRELVDATGIELTDSPDEMLALINGLETAAASKFSASKIAIVAPDSIVAGLVTRFERLRDVRRSLLVFNSMDIVKLWLGVTD